MSQTIHSEPAARPEAILLIGPTGAGKSPLGDLIERRGLWGRPCQHFDFGRILRAIAAGEPPAEALTGTEREFVRRVLHEGALLENEQFVIARKILDAFLEQRRGSCPAAAGEGASSAVRRLLVVLNGLPRHVGQARDVDEIVDIVQVVHLVCPPETALARIRTNAGGDRAGRRDDARAAVIERHRLFERRTRPLLEHYRSRGVRVVEPRVTADSTAVGLHRLLNAHVA